MAQSLWEIDRAYSGEYMAYRNSKSKDFLLVIPRFMRGICWEIAEIPAWCVGMASHAFGMTVINHHLKPITFNLLTLLTICQKYLTKYLNTGSILGGTEGFVGFSR